MLFKLVLRLVLAYAVHGQSPQLPFKLMEHLLCDHSKVSQLNISQSNCWFFCCSLLILIPIKIQVEEVSFNVICWPLSERNSWKQNLLAGDVTINVGSFAPKYKDLRYKRVAYMK